MSARILLAGTHSSVGKTSVVLGLLGAWRRQGLRPAAFKAGPDYIDPGLHSQAAGRPSRNLDVWLQDARAMHGVFRRGMRDAGVAVIEGMMGLFDGIGATQDASTASVARALDCPVILVVDVAGMSGTAAALVLGCQRMEPGVRLAGVVLNRVGSAGHLRSTAAAIASSTGLPVLGSLPNDPSLVLPERHLGLVPVGEGGVPAATLERLVDLVTQRFDLAEINRIAASAPPLPPESGVGLVKPLADPVRIGVAQDRAFGFYYQDTIDLLAESGAEIVPFSPLDDAALPLDLHGLYLGGGFPELHAHAIAANHLMRTALREHVRNGRPLYAECGGLMALGRTLTTFEGEALEMFGILPLDSRMQRERLTIGYREVESLRPSPLMPAGTRVRGHEFHWSVAEDPPAELAAYRIVGDGRLEGICIDRTLGSYVHLNLAGAPELAAHFVASCAQIQRVGAC
jgi:cobyrinic acid a,c-diamide synthase